MQIFLLEDCLWRTHRASGNTCGLPNLRDFLKTFCPNGLLDIKSASRLFCAIRGRNSEDEFGVGVNSGLFSRSIQWLPIQLVCLTCYNVVIMCFRFQTSTVDKFGHMNLSWTLITRI